jgi:hypothetical protein
MTHLPERTAVPKNESLALLFGMTGLKKMCQTFYF